MLQVGRRPLPAEMAMQAPPLQQQQQQQQPHVPELLQPRPRHLHPQGGSPQPSHPPRRPVSPMVARAQVPVQHVCGVPVPLRALDFGAGTFYAIHLNDVSTAGWLVGGLSVAPPLLPPPSSSPPLSFLT